MIIKCISDRTADNLKVYRQFVVKPKSVHRPVKVCRFVTPASSIPKSVHRPARVSRFVPLYRKVSIDLPGSAGLFHYTEKCP